MKASWYSYRGGFIHSGRRGWYFIVYSGDRGRQFGFYSTPGVAMRRIDRLIRTRKIDSLLDQGGTHANG